MAIETWDDAERVAFIALLRARSRGLSWFQIMGEIDTRPSALAFWCELNPADLLDNGTNASELTEARRDIAGWQAAGLGLLTFLDDDYPAQLRAIHDLPPVLFHRGTLVPDDVGVSVVGTRNASPRGLSAARAIAAGLVERGITVVSGLAEGIDTAAHTTALDAGGRTVAVIGTGITRYHPAENRALQDRIASDGMVVSPFWPNAGPSRRGFSMRNTVMSGYGRATIVVEAGERSGARIQAGRAIAHGRPVILTEPVMQANKWAGELEGRPGVHIAAGNAEAMTIVEGIIAGPTEIDTLLAAAGRT